MSNSIKINGTIGLQSDTITAGVIRANTVNVKDINNIQDEVTINIQDFTETSMYIRQCETVSDSTFRRFGTSWALGPTFENILIGCLSGSLIKIDYLVPCRNDQYYWGGMYIEPQIRFNQDSWQSLGSCGYDGGVMHYNGEAIDAYTNFLLITPPDPSLNNFSVSIRFYFRTYEGGPSIVHTVNERININATSGTATLMDSTVTNQNFLHVNVTELAKFL